MATLSPILDADLLVIGTGIATQSVMHQLRNTNLRIMVFEGGQVASNDFSQSLSFSDERGHYINHHWGGHWPRWYGGASRVWNGYSTPLEQWDLVGINGRPKWPMTIDELERYYRLSAPLMGEDPSIANLVKYDYAQFAVDRPYVTTNPPLAYPDPTLLMKNLKLSLHLGHNAIRFTADEASKTINGIWYSVNGEVQYARIKPSTKIVLGTGGLGNAQILLQPADNRQAPVGNESGLVGKTLMAHPHIPAARGFLDPVLVKMPTWAKVKYQNWLPAYILGANYKTKMNLVNTSFQLNIREELDLTENQKTVRQFYQQKWNKTLTPYEMYCRSEQLPDVNNRIEITAEKNAAGLHKMVTYCVFSEFDLMGIDVSARLLSDYWFKNKLGVMAVLNDEIFLKPWGWAHPSGVTRFGFTPKDSVCDANGRVWAYQNLYINGSSLFPTVGYANPTWAIAALGMRLGDHLKASMNASA
jgi:choline dehydrogenase-like flavoprotein